MIPHKVLTVAVLAAATLLSVAGRAQAITIEIGDRPFARHGYHYYEHGHELVWVPGHWARHHRVWVHGHYVRRDSRDWRGDHRVYLRPR